MGYLFRRFIVLVALFLCSHVSLSAQCTTPVIKSITFSEKYFCSSEKPEFTVDLGTTKATSFYVYKEGDPDTHIFEGTTAATSSYTVLFDEICDYYENSAGVMPVMYVVAADGACESEPLKFSVNNQNTGGLTVAYDPVAFCEEGGENEKTFKLCVGDWQQDISVSVYDNKGNTLEPTMSHMDKWQPRGGGDVYSYVVTNDPDIRYYWKIDVSKNRCVKGFVYDEEIKRYMTPPHKLAIDVVPSQSLKKVAEDKYVVCKGETVTLKVTEEENIKQFSSPRIPSNAGKPAVEEGYFYWRRDYVGIDFPTFLGENNDQTVSCVIDDAYKFKVKSTTRIVNAINGCPMVTSNIITIEPEDKPDFSLKTTPDCDNKQVELSLVSSRTYEQSQITATANGKPISFTGKKATAEFTEDTEFEVTVAGKACPAVTKTATAEYDCVKPCPVIESVTFLVGDYFCGDEKPEMILDLGTTTASSFSVYTEFDKETPVYKGTTSLTSSYTLQLNKIAREYERINGTFPVFYVVASDGKCESELTKVNIPYQDTTIKLGYDPVFFCDGYRETDKFYISFSDKVRDVTLYVYDTDGEYLEPSSITHTDDKYANSHYEYVISNDPDKQYFWEIDVTKNRCIKTNRKQPINRWMTVKPNLSLDVELSPNIIKTSDGYVVCKGDEVKLTLTEENASNSVSVEMSTKKEKPCEVCGWIWEYRKKGSGSFTTYSTDNELNIEHLFDASYEFRVKSNIISEFNYCPVAYSNVISIDLEEAPDFSLKANPDCDAKEVELSLISDASYEPSQITATANGKPISFVGNKATSAFTEDTEFEVTVSGKACPAVTKTANVEYDCVEDIEFSLDVDKEVICEGDEVTLTLVATGEYDDSEVFATADGKSIKLTDGKYTAALSLPTKFEMVIVNDVGVTRLEKDVYVESKLEYTIETKVDCDKNEVELHLDIDPIPWVWPKTITSTANGKTIEFSGGKATTTIEYLFSNSEDKNLEVSIAGEACPAIVKNYTVEYDCVDDIEFTLDVDKEVVCENDEATLTLVATGEYDDTKVSATANGKPITLTDGKYTSALAETTKFEVVIANADGTKTTLEKTVEVEDKPNFSLEATPDCEAKEVELSLVSDAAYEPSQITATANGKPISFAGNKATAEFTEDTEFEVTVAGEVCPAVTKTATAEYDCEKKDCEAPICKADKSRIVCSGGDTTEIRVRVDNDVNIDGFYFQFTQDEVCATCTPNWSEPQKFSYRTDNRFFKPLRDWILKIPYNKVGTYRWYAVNGDCKSEEYILEVPEIMESPVLKPIDDFIFCWNDSELEQNIKDAVIELELGSGSVQADGFYFDHFNWYTGYDFDYYTPYDDVNQGNGNLLKSYKAEPGTTFSKRSINVTQFLEDANYYEHANLIQDDPIYIRTYATLGKCRSNPIMFLIFNESKPSFSISAKDDEICPGESTVLNLKKYGKTQEFINYKTYTITDDHGNEYEDAPSIEVSPTEKTVYTVTASGKYCTEPVSKEVSVDIDPSCVVIPEFSLELDKEAICEGGDVELTLVASGEYDATKVTATANGKPIALTDGKYTSALTETTKFEVVIANEDGTETTLDKTVEVEKKPDFSLEATPDCEAKEVELSLISEAAYEPSQITATANGKPISFADNKATAEFTEDTEFEVTVAGEICPAVTKNVTAEYDCTESEFSLELDKEAICEGGDVELTLVASGEYDVTKVTATANGKPIALTDGKYTSALTETTKFEVVIANEDGTETTLDKTVKVEKKPDFSLEATPDCEAKEVELSLISDAVYEPSQITATANGKPISFAGKKATAEFTEDTEFEVTVAGEVCASVTKTTTAEYDCEENDCEAPVIKPIEDLVFCYNENPEFMVELAGEVKADRLEIYDHLPSLGGTLIDEIESAEPAGEFTVSSLNNMQTMEIVDKAYEISLVAVSGKCKSEPVQINLNYEVSPSFSLSVEKDIVCEGEPTILEIEKKKTYNAVSKHTYTIKGDDGSTYEDRAPIKIAPTRMTVYTVTAVGEYCKEPVSKSIAIDIDPYCEDPVFTLKANKTHICVTDEAELSLEATGPYGESWITATANGRPITFTDGKYSATLTETTKFEVVINRPSGNVTKLDKTVEVEQKPEFTLDYDTDCDTKSVELSIVSQQTYAPSQISATANGQRIAMVGGRYKSAISGETKFEVTVEGNNCPASTSTAFVSLENCDPENCPMPPVLKPIADMSFCDAANPKFSVELKREKADKIEITSPALADKIVVENAEPTDRFAVEVLDKTAREFAGSEIKVVAVNGACVSAPVKFRIRHDAEPSVSLADAVACEGNVARMKVSAAAKYQYVWTSPDEGDNILGRSQIYSTIASESRRLNVTVTNGSCDKTLEADLKVVPNPFIDEIQLDGETNEIAVFAKGGSGEYVYDFGYGDQVENVLTDISFGRKYKIVVTDESGCQADSIFYTGIFDIVIPPFFTPNGDGDNDVWKLENIEKYPSAIVTIYNRFGKVIAKTTGGSYKPWDGTYNGHPMITDDYWYVIDIAIIDKSYTGHFTLLRD